MPAAARKSKPAPTPSDLPPAVVALFRGGRNFTTMAKLARAFQVAPETLRGHVERGTLAARRIGLGEKQPRFAVTLRDVEAFWQKLAEESKRGRP